MSTIMSAPSSWSLNNKALPYVPYVSMSSLEKAGLREKTSDRHIASIANMKNIEQALIPVENINFPILLLSGGQDDMWPAKEMAQNVCERATSAKCTHYNYQNAPHVIGLSQPFDRQKPLLGDARAAYGEILSFLKLANDL